MKTLIHGPGNLEFSLGIKWTLHHIWKLRKVPFFSFLPSFPPANVSSAVILLLIKNRPRLLQWDPLADPNPRQEVNYMWNCGINNFTDGHWRVGEKSGYQCQWLSDQICNMKLSSITFFLLFLYLKLPCHSSFLLPALKKKSPRYITCSLFLPSLCNDHT